MQRATISGEKGATPGDTLVFHGVSASDSLYLLRSGENIPLRYFKRIHTGVCFDNKCRELDMVLYWNITGRYLGFELPEGEFLSKSEHKPFSAEEYDRLNELLADSSLPFGDISFNSLMDRASSESVLVDGVSGATSAEMEKIVVPGAAYTTYTLWNIVYGPAFDRVIQLTEERLTPELTDLILHSPDISDRDWALQRIDQSEALDKEISSTLLEMIVGEEFYLSYRAVNAIGSIHLESDSFQSALFSGYGEANFGIQRMIIGKFREAPFLAPEVVKASRNYLDQLNGQQLGDFLNLYSRHSIDDLETCQAIAKILQKENRYISGKAYDFLKGVDTRDSMITEYLDAYERKIKT